MNGAVYIALTALCILVALGATCVIFVMISVIRDLNASQEEQ